VSVSYEARLSTIERSALAALGGRTLSALATDGWAAEVATPERTLRIEPRALPTPDADHPIAGVTRPHVVARAQDRPTLTVVARDLGPIVAIRLHSTVVRFSAARAVPETTLAGIVVPAGIRYEPEFERPARERSGGGRDSQAVVDLDIAIEIVTAGHEAIVYTDGAGLFVSVAVDGRSVAGQERRASPRREVERSALFGEGVS
jgi:hypothetical protein